MVAGIPLRLRLRAASRGVGLVLKRPRWLVMMVAASGVVIGVMLWIFNLNLLAYIWLESGLPLGDKVMFVFQGYGGLVTNFDSAAAATLLTFGLLMGVNVAMLGFVLSGKGRQQAGQGGGKSGVALVAGTIGAGCAACGTGILGPALAAVGASGSISLARTVGVLANLAGIGLVTYSIFGLGQQAVAIVAKDSLDSTRPAP
jgi:hypothetical protein